MLYFRRVLEILILMGAAAAAIWAVAWVYPGAANAPANSKSFWDIASALGTVGAAGVALWIALRDGRERRRIALANANLVAAAVAPEIAAAHHVFSGTMQFFKGRRGLLDRGNLPGKMLFTNVDQTRIYLAALDDRDLAALVALPDHCAHRIARARTLLTQLQGQLKFFEPFFDNDPASGPVDLDSKRAQRDNLLAQLAPVAEEIVELLRSASMVCAEAAKI